MKRQTRQRDALIQALQASGRSLTAQDIWRASAERLPGISLSTVYRQLKDLLELGEVTQVDLPGHLPRFEAACRTAAGDDDHHHHHFHCTRCERVFPIHGCPGPMRQLAPAGFEVERHDLTLHGRCIDCAGAARC